MAKAQAKEKEVEEEKDEKGKGKAKDKEKDDAAGDEGDGAEGEGSPKKSKKKLIIIGAIALVLLLAIGGGAAYFFIGKSHNEEKAAEEIGPDGKPVSKPVYYTLPEFLVNLNVGGKQASFLKTTVILELAKQSDVAWVESNLPRLMDSMNTYLRELRSTDLAGSAGIQRLREELLLRANKALAPVKVNDVLFKEIIVQ